MSLSKALCWVVVAAATCHATCALHFPGDPTPEFSVPTLSGINFTNVVPGGQKPSIMFYRYDERSLFLRTEWNTDSSVEQFIKFAPRTTHFVFFSTQNSKENVQYFKDRIVALSHGDKQLIERCHFVPVGVESVTPWIGEVFHDWKCIDHGCNEDYLEFRLNGDVQLRANRLDARYDFLPSPLSLYNKTLPVVAILDTCNSSAGEPQLRFEEPGSFKPVPWLSNKSWTFSGAPPGPMPFKGQVVATPVHGCDFYTKVKYAQDNGAVAVVLYAGAGEPVPEIVCQGQTCGYAALEIPATTISYADAGKLLELLAHGPVTTTYNVTNLDHFYFGSDHFGNMAEGGWFLYPSLMFLDFQAQWFDYTRRMQQRLSEQADVIPLIHDSVMHGPGGASAIAKLPEYEALRRYSTVELLTFLKCPGRSDNDCAIWDRTMELSVCCTGQETPLCGYELGRYITSFRRGIGYWLTDVTPLLPLLKSSDGQCNFTMRTDPWALPWIINTSLLLKDPVACSHPSCQGEKLARDAVTGADGTVLAPSGMVPLLHGGIPFDKHFNNRTPVAFHIPQGTRAVRLVSVITGHGSDNNGCGEFCVTKHVFTVNGKVNFSITFNDAGTALGCAMRVADGVVPNEHGTWLYGRDGWCDGQEVAPWVVDITSQIDLNPTFTNTILYQGYFNDHTPNPIVSPGEITVFSELVYYTPL